MFLLPVLSETVTDAMTQALGASWHSEMIDQFLTTLGLDGNYDGESDFGTLTRIDLDLEDRVALTLLSAHVENHHLGYDGTADPKAWAKVETMLGFGSDRKWWADWQEETSAEADRIQAEFAAAYSLFLGCEDCGHGHEDDPCICDFDETDGPIVVGSVVKVESYPGVAFRLDRYVPNGNAETHMIGDDRTFAFDPSELTVVEEPVCDCGQLDCGFNAPE